MGTSVIVFTLIHTDPADVAVLNFLLPFLHKNETPAHAADLLVIVVGAALDIMRQLTLTDLQYNDAVQSVQG